MIAYLIICTISLVLWFFLFIKRAKEIKTDIDRIYEGCEQRLLLKEKYTGYNENDTDFICDDDEVIFSNYETL